MSIAARNVTLRSHIGADRHSTLSLGTLYFALFYGDPTGAGVEPTSDGDYARVAMTNDATLVGTLTATDVQASNQGTSGAIVWPALTALWSQATLTHWAAFDNTTGGVLWYSGPLAVPLVVTGVGDVPRIPNGSLVLQVP